ncbi:MAG: oxygen-dependent coproporphyrinogen oxidase [Candidatus Eremiobacteraeota bacterium]|nr:oxygen-dependent coproporphyrinogen oxidase [Candidatus Eremiobacteraeota bacterium]
MRTGDSARPRGDRRARLPRTRDPRVRRSRRARARRHRRVIEQPVSTRGLRAQALFRALQSRLCEALEELDGRAKFKLDVWDRPGGGGGHTATIADGDLFEKGGVNWSAVWGAFDDAALARLGGSERVFHATGTSLVLHPRNPHVPAVHANFRFLERGTDAWFGGGSDLSPAYPTFEDTVHFHRAWKEVCDRHDASYYQNFKRWCDEYFYIPHRGETRGVGGIFFDDLCGGFDALLAFVKDCGETFMPSYAPIARRRRAQPYGDTERHFQQLRRGRYVEFNLVYDRGTAFGLATSGRTESILMSLPPVARWEYDWQPAPGSREAHAMAFFQPRDWLAQAATAQGRSPTSPDELTST